MCVDSHACIHNHVIAVTAAAVSRPVVVGVCIISLCAHMYVLVYMAT